jgi:hypothetical protein
MPPDLIGNYNKDINIELDGVKNIWKRLFYLLVKAVFSGLMSTF